MKNRTRLSLKDVNITGDGDFTGFAVLYNTTAVPADGKPLTIRPGAFAAYLAQVDKPIPVLWDHNEAEPIGVITEWKDGDEGLWVRGKLSLAVTRAKEVNELIKDGVVSGMSAGFIPHGIENGDDGVQVVVNAELYEVSIVTFPAMSQAALDNMPLDSIKLNDAMIFDAKSIKETADGYMIAHAKVARTGIQLYKGYEVGRPDMDVVRVFRPESEVFDKMAMKTFAHRPITIEHPRVPVNSDNWKELSRGFTGPDVVRDGEFISVPLAIMDAEAIRDVKNGKRELSMGYSTELKWESGYTKDGDPFDAIQTSIRANHLAVVSAARGGSQLRIGDDRKEKDTPMSTKQIIVDGVPVQVDDVSAAVISRALEKLEGTIKALQEKLSGEEKKSKDTTDALTVAQKAVETKDGEIAVLKKNVDDAKLKPEQIDALVKDRLAVIEKARALDPKIVTDGKSDADIRKEVVMAKLGDTAKLLTTDAMIEGAFATLTAGGASGTSRMADAFTRGTAPVNANDARSQAFADEGKRLQNAWRNPAPVGAQ